jgi:hypothetical protein
MNELQEEFRQEINDQKDEAEAQHQQVFQQYEHQIEELKKEYEENLAKKMLSLADGEAKLQQVQS